MYKALICGYPRSGNSLLYRIVMSLQGPDFQSFMDCAGLASLARAQCDRFMSFPEIAHLDNLRLPEGIPHLEYPHPEYRLIRVSPRLLDQVSTLIWTHEMPDTIMKSHFTQRQNLYMIRDGRDAIASMVHYSVTARSKRLRPQYRIETAAQVYSNMELFKKWSTEWAAHANSYLMNQDHFYGVRYEDLVASPGKKIKELIEYFCRHKGEDCKKVRKRARTALEAADRDKFRARAPDHMHKGGPGAWKEEWTEEHSKVFLRYAGDEMSRLGYV